MKILKVKSLLPLRMDKYLLEQYPHLGLGRLNKALRENKIKLNGKKQPLSTRVQAGDEIRLFILDEILEGGAAPEGPLYRSARCPAEIVYEDEQVLVANKPAGLPAEDPAAPDTLYNRACLYLHGQGKSEEEINALRLCHRLDTGTSGLIVLAKNLHAEEVLTGWIRDRRVQKTYLCVTFGRPQPEEATLTGWLVKDSAQGRVKIYPEEVPGGKEVETQYETLAFSGRLALLQVRLITGRTHQIRAHLAGIGCPILGDSKYGNNAANRELRLKYQALCAYELRFPQTSEEAFAPLSGRVLHAPKPWYYGQILDGTLK